MRTSRCQGARAATHYDSIHRIRSLSRLPRLPRLSKRLQLAEKQTAVSLSATGPLKASRPPFTGSGDYAIHGQPKTRALGGGMTKHETSLAYEKILRICQARLCGTLSDVGIFPVHRGR